MSPATTAQPSLLAGLAVQWRVMHALLLRELITRFGRENLGVLWLVGEPMIFTLGVTTLWTATGLSHGHGIPVVAFAVTGYSSVLMWRNSATHCGHGIEANKSLLYHRAVRVIDVLVTRIVIEVVGATGSFLMLSFVFINIGWMPVPDDLLEVIGGWLMLAWFGAALGLLIGGAAAMSPVVQRLWQPAAYLLFPMSGAAFMVDWLPRKLQEVVLYLPMVHGIEMIRKGYFGNVAPPHFDMRYMAECNMVLTLAALLLVREAARRVEF